MGDQVGLLVLLGVIVVLAAGFAVMLGARGKSPNDTLNTHEDRTVRQRAEVEGVAAFFFKPCAPDVLADALWRLVAARVPSAQV